MQALLLLGLILGVLAGWAWHRMHRAWTDWRRALAAVALLRRLFWRESGKSALWAVFLIVVAVVLLHLWRLPSLAHCLQ